LALEAMSLDENADPAAIRSKYAELVKRWHPDSNGGDRGAEAQLQKVLKAYQTLKAGGLV
jgi:curved DNA-binding protein CbpA